MTELTSLPDLFSTERNTMAQLLDMQPVSNYLDGPRYKFDAGGFPSKGVKAVGPECDTMEQAEAAGEQHVRDYQAADTMGNMGVFLGVTQLPNGKFRAVVNTYHSRT